MSRRTERVGDLIRGELSRLLAREVADPRVRLATVTEVEVSPDLRHATISISALGEEAARLEAIEALAGARGFLRSRLAHELRLRNTPELVFELDRGAEHSQRIADLLETLHHADDESP